MKKVIAMGVSLACLAACGWGLDLPTITLKYETAQGASEDADDEILQPSSRRDTVSLRIKEDCGFAVFGMNLRYSAKEYLDQEGDYTYLTAEHDGVFRVGDAIRLGYTLGCKRADYPQLGSDGLPKGLLSLRAATTIAFPIVRGTNVDAGLAARFDLADAGEKAIQVYGVHAGVSSRLGDWLLGVRCRGELREPLGPLGTTAAGSYATGSVSLQWDPDRQRE